MTALRQFLLDFLFHLKKKEKCLNIYASHFIAWKGEYGSNSHTVRHIWDMQAGVGAMRKIFHLANNALLRLKILVFLQFIIKMKPSAESLLA